MSRTWHRERKEKRGHKEYWKSRYHRYGEIPGTFMKKLTHHKERRDSRKIEREGDES